MRNMTYNVQYGVATISKLFKIIVLFCKKEPYKRDDILQKRHIIVRSLLIAGTQYDVRAHSAI